jgi:beta-aspartyl-peptidase (threonine type)
MEESELFNAGRGAVFTHAGTIEMDASIMDGRHAPPPRDIDGSVLERWSAGAVASVTRVHSPIACARRVMSHSNHVMLASSGADTFCEEQGLRQELPDYFTTERRYAQLLATVNSTATQLSESEGRRRVQQEAPAWGEISASSDSVLFDMGKYGTVGAVARDADGHLAAATSTGGLSNKQHGRVVRSAILPAASNLPTVQLA